jgi:acyl-CoA synthetase (AMP-forming)/AMP-acid ligase II
MTSMTHEPTTFVDVLEERASELGAATLYEFLLNGEVDGPRAARTFAEQATRARAVGAYLSERGLAGERALLLYPPGIDFMDGFLGCLHGGVIAVPAYPPDPSRLDRTLPRLQAIAADCGAKVILTTSEIKQMAGFLLPQAPDLGLLEWVATDELDLDLASRWKHPGVTADSVAFLQYTSGSTATPKGVILTHANLLHNNRMIAEGFGHQRGKQGVSWLPLYHDMGLIGHVLQPLFVGFPCAFMSPIAFLKQPLRWLRAVSHFKATTSGGPNFAFDLCSRKASAADVGALDLSSWEVAFNGAEPVRLDTLERFAATFAPAGFRRQAFYPCYGLAEATLIVTGAARAAEPISIAINDTELQANRASPSPPASRTCVSSGQSLLAQDVLIVDPESHAPCAAGQVGEIWVRGPSVASGYWNRPDETRANFGGRLAGSGEGPFLRTGDLGFAAGGEVFVTGRRKDLMIFRGRNYYPQDVEQVVEQSHPSVRAGCVAAFSTELGGHERLVIVAEVDSHPAPADVRDVATAIRGAVASRLELQPHGISLLKARSIPKTSSGKIQRHACRDGWRSETLEIMHTWVLGAAKQGGLDARNL